MENFAKRGSISIGASSGCSVGKVCRSIPVNDIMAETITAATASSDTGETGRDSVGVAALHAESVSQAIDSTNSQASGSRSSGSTDASSRLLQRQRAKEDVQPTTDSTYEAAPEFMHLWAAVERRFMQNPNHSAVLNELISSTPPIVLGVTSAVVGEGKTTVAINLAESAARYTWFRVCLVDLGLGDDEISRRHGVESDGTGAITMLERCDEGEFATQSLPTYRLENRGGLTILPAGKAPNSAARTARSPNVTALIKSLRESFDLVIVDMPAIATENALPLAMEMDGIVMVARAGATPGDVIENAVNHIGRQRVIGVVLNRVSFAGPKWLKKRLTKW